MKNAEFAQRAINETRGLSSYVPAETGNTRVIRLTIGTDIVRFPLGDHSHLIIENLGGSTVQIVMSNQAVDWLEATSNKALDGHTEPFLFLKVAAATADVRATVWGLKTDVEIK